ncbi:uncharacterized protein LOC113239515 [Hyposmocoma kahamanoa]|uniref:uncharacterized protein LOC113239515 n=1 Tax=Hyposmocoma kahamanoa TaxID=1477025 RepID=UPI000E6D985A|nr:uncharacterized protein LOC113239515 [Hyposmocoma kahamanoa]
MLEEVVKDYSDYFKVDIASGFQTVQDVIDNMLTRLEELASVLQMIKLKNSDCSQAVTEDINRYRAEVTTLSKKVYTLNKVIEKLQSNMDVLEKQVEKAELDFGVNNDNKIRSFLKPFLKRAKDAIPASHTISTMEKVQFESVLNNFDSLNGS